MAGYKSKYIPLEVAVEKIAAKHFDRHPYDAYMNLRLAEKEGAIKLRYQHNQPAQSLDDYLSQRISRHSHGEEYEREGLEKYYGPLWDEGTKEESPAAEATTDQLKLALACVQALKGQQALKKNIIEWLSSHWNDYIRSGELPTKNDLERIATLCRDHKAKKGGYSSKEG